MNPVDVSRIHDRIMIGRGLGYFKIWPKKSLGLNVNLSMALNEESTQTMLLWTTIHSFFANSVQIFILFFFSLIEPPKTEILYVYTVCVHIQNHDMVE